MTIEQSKTRQEFETALAEERDNKEVEKLVRMSKSTSSGAREMAKVMGQTNYGLGDYSPADAGTHYSDNR